MIFGLILIVVGALLLVRNLGIITGNVWDIVWPVVIIAIGLMFFFKRKCGHRFCCGHREDDHDHGKEEESQQK